MLDWLRERYYRHCSNQLVDLATARRPGVHRAPPHCPRLGSFLRKARAGALQYRTRLAVQADLSPADLLSCPVCLEQLQRPKQTPCGHTFCQMCLCQSLSLKNACPVCRMPVDNFVLGQAVQIRDAASKLNDPERELKFKSWQSRRKVTTLYPGKQVDLMVGTSWLRASIHRIISAEKEVRLRLKAGDRVYQVSAESLRVAPSGTFSTGEGLDYYLGSLEFADVKEVKQSEEFSVSDPGWLQRLTLWLGHQEDIVN